MAKAAQKYGMYLHDGGPATMTSGVFVLEDAAYMPPIPTRVAADFSCLAPNKVMANFPWSKVQVLAVNLSSFAFEDSGACWGMFDDSYSRACIRVDQQILQTLPLA